MNTTPLPRIITERTVIKLLEPQEANLMARYRVENKSHLTEWEPTRSQQFYTEHFWQAQLLAAIREFRLGASLCLVILDRDENEVLGVCNYTNIIRGTFEACHLGYGLAEKHQGKGLMFESLTHTTRYVFDEMRLHRIMASYLPRNSRSGALLERMGFEVEGKARKYLKINGVWEDHILTALTNPTG
jgi:ribosomal-protein-alanine N-acetyltransferase